MSSLLGREAGMDLGYGGAGIDLTLHWHRGSCVTRWPFHTLSQPASVRGMLPVDTVLCIEGKSIFLSLARATRTRKVKIKNHQNNPGSKRQKCYFCSYI